MAITVVWKGGDDVTTVASDQYIGFFRNTFGSSVRLDNYQETTTATNATGTSNLGALPNIRYTTPGYAIWASSSGSLDNIARQDDYTLHIQLSSGSAKRLQSVQVITYSGSITDLDYDGNIIGPGTLNVLGFESGSTSWTYMSGSVAPLVLTPHNISPATSHDYYVGLSASPTRTGVNDTVSVAIRAEWY